MFVFNNYIYDIYVLPWRTRFVGIDVGTAETKLAEVELVNGRPEVVALRAPLQPAGGMERAVRRGGAGAGAQGDRQPPPAAGDNLHRRRKGRENLVSGMGLLHRIP